MTPILSRFKTLGMVAILAAALGTAGLSAAPAVAQDAPPSGFSLNVPQPTEAPPVNPNTGKMAPPGMDNSTARTGHYDPDSDDFYYCLDDDEIEEAIESYGFSRARVVRYYRDERVEVTAYWGRSQYSMRVDRCTGEVDRVRLMRRSGFGLQFNFSN